MAQLWTEKRVVVSTDGDTLAHDVADRLLVRLIRRSLAGKTSHIALTGGVILPGEKPAGVFRTMVRHRGVLARPVLLNAYKLFAQIAQNDTAVHSALKSVIEFFSRPQGASNTGAAGDKPA